MHARLSLELMDHTLCPHDRAVHALLRGLWWSQEEVGRLARSQRRHYPKCTAETFGDTHLGHSLPLPIRLEDRVESGQTSGDRRWPLGKGPLRPSKRDLL